MLSATQTWNNAAAVFTALKVNVTVTANAAGSKLFDLQSAGTSAFWFDVDKGAYLYTGFNLTIDENGPNASDRTRFLGGYAILGATTRISWASDGPWNSGRDVGLYRNAAGVLEINNGDTAGTFRDLKLRDIFSTSTAFMHRIAAVVASGGAAGAGTLSNAPVAGNPTKWMPIDDNGVTRYIPCW